VVSDRETAAGVLPVDDGRSEPSGSPASSTRPADLAAIELRHAIPGRIRLKIPSIKGEPGLALEVHKQLAALPVIRRVEVNPVTGSVLVLYDPADSAAIAQLGRMMIPGLDLNAMPDPPDHAPRNGHGAGAPALAVTELARRLNERVEAISGGALDLKVLVPMSLVVGGLVRLIASRKVPSPAWYDFLWFAFGTYFTLNRGSGPDRPEQSALGCGESDDSEPAADHTETAYLPHDGTPR
jgi:hypothetical protein